MVNQNRFEEIIVKLPIKVALKFKFLVECLELARTESDLFIQIFNDFITKNYHILKDDPNWVSLIKAMDKK